MRIRYKRFFFALFDFWVGFYYDRDRRLLYFCPIPCFVLLFEVGEEKPVEKP